jgi:hypothetical protein
MSYLQLPNGIPDFSQAIISFWFRVPQTSINALQARNTADFATSPYPRLAGIMPLVTFGQLFEGRQSELTWPQDASYQYIFWEYEGPAAGGLGWQRQIDEPPHIVYSTGPVLRQSEAIYSNPCYVGIALDGDGQPFLNVFLQTKDMGEPSWLYALPHYFITDQNYGVVTGTLELQNPMSAWDGAECVTDSTAPNNPWIYTQTWTDASREWMPELDSFRAGSNKMKIIPDQWHHVLLSFDLVSSNTSGSYFVTDGTACAHSIQTQTSFPSLGDASKIWIAFDDVNYTGGDLRGFSTDFGSFPVDLGKNDMISRFTMMTYLTIQQEQHIIEWAQQCSVQDRIMTGAGVPSYTYPANPLPASGQPFGIPAAANVSDKILHVEMAEFQMWVGKTLDTGDVKNRRAFIDANGKPVPPNKQPTANDPTSGSIALLGKPDVTLHGSGNWVKGHNTGTTGTDADGKDIPSGQFKATGKIKAYRPDPSLHGPQSPATKP